jgi:hypothetical protein
MTNKIKKENGESLRFFHGTNRNFTVFDKNKSRTALNEKYQGDWLCFSPEEDVAWKYADAARNQNIDKEAFLIESEKLFNDLLREDHKDLMMMFINSYLDKGSERCYEDADQFYAKRTGKTGDIEFHAFQEFNKIEQLLGIDMNDLGRILESVEGCKLDDDKPDGIQDVMNFFNSQVQELSDSVIEYMKTMGYKDSIPVAKVFEVEITANNVLKTKNKDKAKAAIEGDYDLVIYSGTDLVDGVEEYLVKNPDQIEVKAITRRQEITEELGVGEYRTHYDFKKEIINNSPKNKKRIRP